MSRSDWGKRAKAGLTYAAVVAALSFGIWIIVNGLARDAEYQGQADDRSREYAAYTREQIREHCFPLSGQNESDCIAEKQHEYGEDRRDERDLVAQRKSANWAFIMGAAAVLGMVLSAVGVALVWTTFRETRRAANSASQTYDAFVAVERARLTVGISDFTDYANGLSCELTAWNTGKSSCVANFVGYLSFPDPVWPELGFPGNGRDTPIKADEGVKIVKHHEHQKARTFYVIGMVVYASPFKADHRTHFCVEVVRSDAGPHTFRPRVIRAEGQPVDT